MGIEIERKFLVRSHEYKLEYSGVKYRQGYLNTDKNRTVRLRTAGEKAFLTIKGITTGASRAEYEYEIPFADCQTMLDTLAEKPLIEKIRYTIPFGGVIWEVDEFLGENQGLVVAEVELQSEDQSFGRPDWVGEEVTADPRYFNSSLSRFPYSRW